MVNLADWAVLPRIATLPCHGAAAATRRLVKELPVRHIQPQRTPVPAAIALRFVTWQLADFWKNTSDAQDRCLPWMVGLGGSFRCRRPPRRVAA